ncbi:MAG: ammonium transporter [Elainellaceae cyanobacterium]
MDKPLADILWVIICALLVFLMQAGFLCLEAGTTRSKNNINVVIKNVSDLGVSVLLFWLFGYALMFGYSLGGWVGRDEFAPSISQDPEVWPAVFFLFQVMFCSTAVTIVSGAVAERMRFSSYLLMAALVTGFIYPVFGHWAWNGLREGQPSGWLEARGFIDFAGSTVVHSVGGWVSLAAVLILGPRIGRFSRKRRYQLGNGSDLPLALLGTLLLWLGWFGFNGGSVLALNDEVPGVIANTVLAGCGGLITPILLAMSTGKQVKVSAIMNGSLAGLVAITANCHAVLAGSAILIGMVGCLIMLMTEELLIRLKIDDVVGAIPVHLGAGIWGTLAVALLGDLDILGTGLSRFQQLQVQILGIVVCGVWTFGVAYVLLLGIDRFYPIRVSHKDEHIGLNVSEHGASSDLVDLFTVMRRQERTGDLSLRVRSEASTPVGQIARRYNRVIASLEELTARTEAIVKTAIDAILTVSQSELMIQTANPAVQGIFGYSENQLVGRSLNLLVDLDRQSVKAADLSLGDATQSLLLQASVDGTPYEILGKRRTGGTFPLEVTVNETVIGRETVYTVIMRDITLRKEAEDALLYAEAQDRKSQQLEYALKDLRQTQAQLVQTEKMSSLGQLVAGVAHEINNPVNFIYGNLNYASQYLRDLLNVVHLYQKNYPHPSDDVTQKLKEIDLEFIERDLPKLLQSMHVGTERIREIVMALRIFSRLDEAEVKDADLHQNIDSTLLILKHRLKDKPDRPAVQVITAYSQLPPVLCHPGQLNQVFMNILVNAIDALDERDGDRTYEEIEAAPSTIWIATEMVDEEFVEIRIADNGPGIAPDVQSRLFDPFFTTKPSGKGTGLGLSISHRIIVEKHKGKLECHSSPGMGTKFVIQIPHAMR